MKKIQLNLALLLLAYLLVIIANTFGWWTDDSDRSGWNRSGLSVYVDAATGINYVKAGWFGGTCVRINTNGTPFVTK